MKSFREKLPAFKITIMHTTHADAVLANNTYSSRENLKYKVYQFYKKRNTADMLIDNSLYNKSKISLLKFLQSNLFFFRIIAPENSR